MATPYQNVAKAALINWNGLSEEEAQKKVESESFKELESQVFAVTSIKYAVIGISKQIGLTDSEAFDFFLAVINGPEDAKIFDIVKEKTNGFTEKQELNVLSNIHDVWVKDNSSEKDFNEKVEKEQLRQYAPLELIGWNEVKSHLLFLNPFLESMGVKISEVALEKAYYDRVVDYLNDGDIYSQHVLTYCIRQGSDFYPALPEGLEDRLVSMSEVVADQIIKNWNDNNPALADIFIPEPVYEEMAVNHDDNLERVTCGSVNLGEFDQDNSEEELESMEQEYKNIYGDRVEIRGPGKVIIFPKF